MPVVEIKDRLVLFIHVPKTGGTTIEHHLAEAGPLSLKSPKPPKGVRCNEQHFHAELIEGLFAPTAFYYAFMVVRHPLSRLLSEYRWQTRKRRRLRSRLSFSLWLRYALACRRLDPYCYDNHLRPQAEFEIRGAEVFRWEDGLQNCFGRLTEQLGIAAPQQLETLKNSTVRPSIIVRESDIELVHQVYRQDFERYGYGRVPEVFALEEAVPCPTKRNQFLR